MELRLIALIGLAFILGIFGVIVVRTSSSRRRPSSDVPQNLGSDTPRPSYAQRQQILNLIQAKQSIEAIKLYREITHCSLKEAKEMIDLWQQELR